MSRTLNLRTADEIIAHIGTKKAEQCRRMIEMALTFLDKEEIKWGLRKPMSRLTYIRGLLGKARDCKPS